MANFALFFLITSLSLSPARASWLTCLQWPSDSADSRTQQYCVLNRAMYNDIERGTIVRAASWLLDEKYALAKYWITIAANNVTTLTTDLDDRLKGSLIFIYELNVWQDILYCLIDDVRQHMSTAQAAHNCTIGLEGPDSLLHSVMWSSENTSDIVTTNLTNFAPLLIPVGLGDFRDDVIPDNSTLVSLVVPGTEKSSDTPHVFKLANNAAQGFNNEIEAEIVKEHLGNATWSQQNCQLCAAPDGSIPPSTASSGRTAKRGDNDTTLHRRVGSLNNVCCKLPPAGGRRFAVPPDQLTVVRRRRVHALRTPLAIGNSNGNTNGVPNPPPEPILNIPRALPRYDWRRASDIIRAVYNDNTVLMSISDGLQKSYPADEMFQTLRDIFTQKNPAALDAYNAFAIGQTSDFTWYSNSLDWTYSVGQGSRYSMIGRLQAWFELADLEILSTLQSTSLLDHETFEDLYITTEISYLAPGHDTTYGTTIGGTHSDYGLMSLELADQPGTVVLNNAQQPIRLPVEKDAWYAFRGNNWAGPWAATKQLMAVPDNVQYGRISIKKTIDRNDAEAIRRHRTWWKGGSPPDTGLDGAGN